MRTLEHGNCLQRGQYDSRNYMTITDCLRFCKLEGRTITDNGLMYAGKIHGFSKKHSDGFHWLFEIRAVRAWLESTKPKPVPAGFVPLKDILRSEALKPGGIINKWVYGKLIETRRCGKYPYRIHVNAKQFSQKVRDWRTELARRQNERKVRR